MPRFLREIWNALAGYAEQLNFLSTLLTLCAFALAALGWILSRRYATSYRKRVHDLLDKNVALTHQLETEKVKSRLKMRELDPGLWLEEASREREQGNEERAIHALEHGFDRVRSDLAACAIALAGHHFSLVVSDEPERHLSEGTRFARLASDLEPGNGDAAFLLEEAKLLTEAKISEISASLPAAYLPHHQGEAIQLLEALLVMGRQWYEAGYYRLCTRLYRRGELVLHRAGLVQSNVGIRVAFANAQALLAAGYSSGALEAIDGFLKHFRDAKSHLPHEVRAMRHLRIDALYILGRYHIALEALDILLPQCIAEYGAGHSEALFLSFLKVKLLVGTGEYSTALDMANALKKARGKSVPEALQGELLRADIINTLGHHRQAIKIIEALAPCFQKTYGKDHSKTLILQILATQFYYSMGEYGIAGKKLEPLSLALQEILGKEHPDVLGAQCLKAQIGWANGELQDSFESILQLLPALERVKGAEHPHTLASIHFKVRVMLSLKKYDDAEKAVSSLLVKRRKVSGIHHPQTLGTQRLWAEILVQSGRPDEGIAICDGIVSLEPDADHAFTKYVKSLALASKGETDGAAKLINEVIEEKVDELVATHWLLTSAKALKSSLHTN